MQAEATLAHVAVGGNAISNALSTNRALPSRLVKDSSVICAAVGAKNGVALVTRDQRTPSLLKIREVLQHYSVVKESTRITSVYLFAPSVDCNQRVLAGDSEGNVLLWTKLNDKWHLHHLVNGDGEKLATDSVAAVTAVQTQRRWLYVASFSNGHIAVFEQPVDNNAATPTCILQKKMGVKMIMETLAATTWSTGRDEDDVLIAAGGVDSKVYLFEVASGSDELKQLFALEGHRGWIRSVDFERRRDESGSIESLFLASASQDHRVRLWKISTVPHSEASDVRASATSSGYQSVGASSVYTVSFDSLLIAHEDWVTSLVWTVVGEGGDEASALVSTSMDNTVIVWKKNSSVGASRAWVPWLRVGDHGGNGILSSTLLPSSDPRLDLLALNFSGHLERWLQEPAPSKMFQPAVSLNGHTSPVTDISWSPRGDYLISLSLDQTTRVLAQWHANRSWLEISRAQVHGYDIICGAFIAGDHDGHNDRFVCGADEKILRIFEAPDDIEALVNTMGGVNNAETDSTDRQQRIEHAYLPELSLTNKSADDKTKKGAASGSYSVLGDGVRVPVGETLAKKTLWPEQRKLYGHGNELLCVASNHAGTLLASACKSREEKFAAVWLWNTKDWSAVAPPLDGHKSSVVQLAFSPDDQFLLSVSKDRQFCVYAAGDNSYTLVDHVKAHKRIIWSCSWAPTSWLFATGARDQTVAFWGKHPTNNKWTPRGESILLDSAVTAVAFAPWTVDGSHQFLLAVGVESGRIFFYHVDYSDPSTVVTARVGEVPLELSPSATVTRLAWMPHSAARVLACCSADHSVRVYHV